MPVTRRMRLWRRGIMPVVSVSELVEDFAGPFPTVTVVVLWGSHRRVCLLDDAYGTWSLARVDRSLIAEWSEHSYQQVYLTPLFRWEMIVVTLVVLWRLVRGR